jgi:hypothetical protein
MKSLLGMMIDGGSEVFWVAARSSVVAAPFRVGTTIRAVDVGQHLAAPPFVEARNPFIELRFVGLRVSSVLLID